MASLHAETFAADVLPRRWGVWLLAVVAAGLSLARFLPHTATHRIASESVLYHYGGNLLIRGYAPYLHHSDIKPPALYDTTALIALVAPQSPWTQFWIGAGLSAVCAITAVVLVGLITGRATGSNCAALAAGFVPVAFPTFLTLPLTGLWSKYLAIVFGLAAFYVLLDERYLLAAGLATLAAGYWQWVAIVPAVVLAETWRTDADMRRVLAVAGGVTAVVVAPIVLAGAAVPMIEQVIIKPIVGGNRSELGVVARIVKLHDFARFVWPLFAAGVVGGGYRLAESARGRPTPRATWWAAAGLVWTLAQLAFFDFDWTPDVLLFVVFAGLGLGLFVGRLRPSDRVLAVTLVALIAAGQLYDVRHLFVGPVAAYEPPGATPLYELFLDSEYSRAARAPFCDGQRLRCPWRS